MAASDARPIPRKNVAYRVYFPILDNDGDLVTGAAGLDSEASLDGAAFSDCTNEATEIGSSGMYYLDLTSGEMNADAVVVIVKTSTTDAKTAPIVFYPEEAGDVRVDVVQFGGTALTSAAGIPEVKVASIAANAITATTINADAITAAKIADGAIDAATFAAGAITATVIATDAIDADAIAANAVTEIQSGLATASALTTVDTVVDAIKVKTDSLTFSTANRVDAQVFGMESNVMTAAAAAADLTTELQSGLATAAALTTVDTVVDAIKVTTDKVDDTLEDDAGTFRFTTNALEQAPSGGLDAAGVRAAVGLASANLDTQLDTLPTAVENADALLNRDMSLGTDSGSPTVRTPRQALRFLRNKWAVAAGTLTVNKEDDSTASWTAAVTATAGADPVTEVDPA